MNRDLLRRERRHVRRWMSRTAIGGLCGAAFGALSGGVIGSIPYRAGSLAMWLAVIAAAIFFGAVGALVGGMSSLESPDPGTEPSQFDDPVREPGGLTQTEEPPRRSERPR
jgi:hypothetical protein